jgi:TPR repeat protein
MKIKNLLVLLTLSTVFGSYAAQEDGSSQQVYDAMRLAADMYNMETANDQCPTNDRSGFLGVCVTENSKKEFRLQEVLRLRADAGEPVAMFYWGVMLAQSGARRSDTEIGMKASKESYEMALGYYKKACVAAISEACWNIADIYAKGLGRTKSGLAAAEWFYKAGLGYLTNGQREEALASLEEIEKIDKAHPLGKKLSELLAKGAPK